MTGTDAALAEGRRLLSAAHKTGIPLCATGGVAVALNSPSALTPPLRREYRDIDFVAHRRDRHRVEELFAGLGYMPEEEFNLFHGQRRLFFHHREQGYEADVFLDKIEMCHTLDLRSRINERSTSVSLADLLLSKLQVMQTNAKDFKDITALLADHPLGSGPDQIELDRIDEVCASDWGWWKTVTLVIARTQESAREFVMADGSTPDSVIRALDRLGELLEHLERVPKSRRWKLRAQVGERVRWHEEPEDIEHDVPQVASP